MRKSFSLLIVTLMMVALVMVPLTNTAKAATLPEEYNDKYYGYVDKANWEYNAMNYKFALYQIPVSQAKEIIQTKDYDGSSLASQEDCAAMNDAAEVVYCMDASKDEPVSAIGFGEDAWWIYDRYVADEAMALEGCTKLKNKLANMDSEAILRGLSWVMLNGYPNNTFQGDMSDSDYRAVTQWAVYYYAMGGQTKTLLTTQAQKDAADMFQNIPEDFNRGDGNTEFSIYKPINKGTSQYFLGIKKTVAAPEPKIDGDGEQGNDGDEGGNGGDEGGNIDEQNEDGNDEGGNIDEQNEDGNDEGGNIDEQNEDGDDDQSIEDDEDGDDDQSIEDDEDGETADDEYLENTQDDEEEADETASDNSKDNDKGKAESRKDANKGAGKGPAKSESSRTTQTGDFMPLIPLTIALIAAFAAAVQIFRNRVNNKN